MELEPARRHDFQEDGYCRWCSHHANDSILEHCMSNACAYEFGRMDAREAAATVATKLGHHEVADVIRKLPCKVDVGLNASIEVALKHA